MTMRATRSRPEPRQWLFIANAARARCFERDPENHALRELAAFVHPQSRMKGGDLEDDRQGHAIKGAARTGLARRSDVHEKEHVQFARELARFLDGAALGHQFEHLILMASNPFLGELRSHMGELATSRVRTCLAVDLTTHTGADLERRVTLALAPRRRRRAAGVSDAELDVAASDVPGV